MTESLLKRLHHGLQPRYSVREELGQGGMAIVYLGYDHSLEREVAIKLLRPELATAALAERFLREARVSARIHHPNVISIHDYGETDGLNYFVMDLISGETLEARLARGRLGHDEAVGVALQVLDALAAAHALGVVHRDIKPANIFLSDDRVLVGDFGVAKLLDETTGLTQPDMAIGTPAYMAPEQFTGMATAATDIHAVGMVLYESLTGRHPSASGGHDGGPWERIPRRIAKPLRRALLPDPKERWQTAAAFRSQLRGAPRFRPLMGGAAVTLIVGVVLVGMLTNRGRPARAPPTDLALLPCFSLPGSAALTESLEFLAVGMLRDVSGARFTPHQTSSGWWTNRDRSRDLPLDSLASSAASAFNADRVATCRVVHDGADSLRISVQVFDRRGVARHLPPIIAPADDPPVAAASILALKLLEEVDPTIPLSSTGYAILEGHDPEAVSAFLSGALAFRRDAREEAVEHFADAVAIDSAFTLATWRLADVQRWGWTSQTAIDLDSLFSAHADDLGAVDRRMLEAAVTRRGGDQFALYEALIEDYPNDPYATLSYGDELFHRGPLFGIDLDSALVVLKRATDQDSFLAPAFDHLTWLLIRLGDQERALLALDHLDSIKGDFVLPGLLRLAYFERFDSERAPLARREMLGRWGAGGLEPLALVRYSLSFGLPETQLDFGNQLVLATAASPALRDGPLIEARANGHLAQGLALVALGRPREATAHFDSSAAAAGTTEARLVAAQWRVLPRTVGLIGMPESEREAGAAVLGDLARDPGVEIRLRARAAWSRLLREAEKADTAAAQLWLAELRSLPLADGDSALLLLGEAVLAAETGDISGALEISAPLAQYDSTAILRRPFQRAISYLKRGQWFELTGSPERADSAWTWYENLDLEGLPVGPLQAAEVDWALGVHGRMLRAGLRSRDGDNAGVCSLAGQVIRYWSEAEPAFGARVEEARAMCAP